VRQEFFCILQSVLEQRNFQTTNLIMSLIKHVLLKVDRNGN